MEYGWGWWFDGTNPSQGWSGWSQVDVPGGGFYDPPHHFNTYYHEQNTDSKALSAIDAYLHSGYGVTAAIYTDAGGGHAVTIWGYDFEGQYKGLWITDSDDDKNNPNPPDSLRYYDVAMSGGRWFLQDYYGTSDTWHIGSVQALDRAPIPLPPAILLLLSGLAGLIGLRRSFSQR